MKNQNDMIISIVAVVLALIVAGILMATQREPEAQNPVTPVVTAMAKPPAGTVVMANSLPNAGKGQSAGAPGGGGGGMMGAKGMETSADSSTSTVGRKGSQFLQSAKGG